MDAYYNVFGEIVYRKSKHEKFVDAIRYESDPYPFTHHVTVNSVRVQQPQQLIQPLMLSEQLPATPQSSESQQTNVFTPITAYAVGSDQYSSATPNVNNGSSLNQPGFNVSGNSVVTAQNMTLLPSDNSIAVTRPFNYQPPPSPSPSQSPPPYQPPPQSYQPPPSQSPPQQALPPSMAQLEQTQDVRWLSPGQSPPPLYQSMYCNTDESCHIGCESDAYEFRTLYGKTSCTLNGKTCPKCVYDDSAYKFTDSKWVAPLIQTTEFQQLDNNVKQSFNSASSDKQKIIQDLWNKRTASDIDKINQNIRSKSSLVLSKLDELKNITNIYTPLFQNLPQNIQNGWSELPNKVKESVDKNDQNILRNYMTQTQQSVGGDSSILRRYASEAKSSYSEVNNLNKDLELLKHDYIVLTMPLDQLINKVLTLTTTDYELNTEF